MFTVLLCTIKPFEKILPLTLLPCSMPEKKWVRSNLT